MHPLVRWIALRVINSLNLKGTRELSTADQLSSTEADYMDVSGDGYVSPLDALRVINHLNQQAPSPLSLKLSLDKDTGNSAVDFVTSEASVNVLLSETIIPLEAKVWRNGKEIVPIVSPDGRRFQIEPSLFTSFQEGQNDFTVMVWDSSNRLAISRLSFTYDVTFPDVSALKLPEGYDTGVSDIDGVTKHDVIPLRGTATVGDHIRLTVDDVVLLDGVSTGSYEATTPILENGKHEIRLVVTDLAGNARSFFKEIFVDKLVPPDRVCFWR